MTESRTAATLVTSGFAAHQAGETSAARECFQSALNLEPDNSEAWHLLGLVELDTDPAEAARLVGKAVEIAPREPLYRANLSRICERLGDMAGAAGHLRVALDVAPSDAQAWTRLWRLERAVGNMQGASEAFLRAALLLRTDAAGLRALGDRALKMDDANAAVRAAEFLILHPSAEADAYRIACIAMTAQRRWADVSRSAADWSRRFPQETLAWRLLSGALFELNQFEAARDAFEPVLRLEPQSVDNKIAYGRLRSFAGDHEGARAALENAAESAPQSAEANAALANALMQAGDVLAAEKLARKAIDADPSAIIGYVTLADIQPHALKDNDIEAMQKARAIAPEHQARLRFAIGAAYDARGEYSRAFENFAAANELKRGIRQTEGMAYDPAERTEYTNRLARLSAKAGEAKRTPQAGDFTPVFIVGMPRSGTTLVESIIAAHPQAHGGGELTWMPAILGDAIASCEANGYDSFADAPAEVVGAWRSRYLGNYSVRGAARIGIDKQPNNHAALGLISAALPDARIIHVRRNPVEVCFSIYRRDFPKAWRYANSVKDLAHYYGEYARLSALWDAMLGENYLSIELKHLRENFEPNARRIIAHCGLAWREECASFHEKKRIVSTFSATQVRRPVYSPESALSQYGAHLRPLIEALEQAGVDPATGRLIGQ